ncbi:hypothetical protein [Crateriforma conspicua]|uniref:TubC N-terminal docking domain-containing protein n=1 Tax=Crateriforma conspicua TaxID=2527996 RepID=A0A5C5Y7X9_9PLAN|nr:hypothetical protein [Crateriforma conspicua]TWT69452.1 hypothetical protein Pan14r_17380 [Crateriforma conspicua]
MTPDTLLTNFADRGIVIALAGDDIKWSASKGIVTPGDVGTLRDHKPGMIRLLRLAEGLPADDDAAQLLSMDEVDPADVPVCDSCGRLCDVQRLDDAWHCSRCDPKADERRRRTEGLLRSSAAIRYTSKRNG